MVLCSLVWVLLETGKLGDSVLTDRDLDVSCDGMEWLEDDGDKVADGNAQVEYELCHEELEDFLVALCLVQIFYVDKKS